MNQTAHPTFDVIGIGTVCWDFVCTVSRYPALDEKAEYNQLLQQGGGPTATGVVAVARLGGRAAMWGRVGDDDFGHKCAGELVAEGVDIAHLEMVAGKTSQFAFCVAQEDTGQRSIFYKPGTAGKLDPAALDPAAVVDCRAMLIGHHHAAAAVWAAGLAREAGVPVVLDLERPGPDDEALLAAADYPILPAEYLATRTGEPDPLTAGMALHRELGRLVIVTRGAAGSLAFVDGRIIEQPAFAVAPVIDTTGAGDVFHGAFTYGLTLGYDLEENLRFASAVAALKCRALGGRTGIPSMAQTREFLAAQGAR